MNSGVTNGYTTLPSQLLTFWLVYTPTFCFFSASSSCLFVVVLDNFVFRGLPNLLAIQTIFLNSKHFLIILRLFVNLSVSWARRLHHHVSAVTFSEEAICFQWMAWFFEWTEQFFWSNPVTSHHIAQLIHHLNYSWLFKPTEDQRIFPWNDFPSVSEIWDFGSRSFFDNPNSVSLQSQQSSSQSCFWCLWARNRQNRWKETDFGSMFSRRVLKRMIHAIRIAPPVPIVRVNRCSWSNKEKCELNSQWERTRLHEVWCLIPPPPKLPLGLIPLPKVPLWLLAPAPPSTAKITKLQVHPFGRESGLSQGWLTTVESTPKYHEC
jgi:hypothetical protein